MPRTDAIVLTLVVTLTAAPAFAQGHRGAPPGQLKKSSPSNGAAPGQAPSPSGDVPAMVTADVRARSFGNWLDDATVAAPGSLWVTGSLVGWSSPVGQGFDVPAISVAAGLTRRAQFSLAVPYSRVSSGGLTASGFGDIYSGVKLQLVEPSERRIGVSISPTLEVLSSAQPREAHLVLPISMEVGRGNTRVYGSGGWFSRGALFAGAALERHLSDRFAVTGALLQSWSTSGRVLAEQMGLARTRTDVSGLVTAFVGPSIALFGGVARTVSPVEFDSSTFVAFGGVAMQVTPAAGIPVRVPR